MAFLEEPVTSEEVVSVIKSLKNNRTPGNDGFSAEFYKVFTDLLATPLSHTINEIFTLGRFPPSWNKVSIIVIPKKDRDPLDIKSFCPISQLNQDYKIFTAILT